MDHADDITTNLKAALEWMLNPSLRSQEPAPVPSATGRGRTRACLPPVSAPDAVLRAGILRTDPDARRGCSGRRGWSPGVIQRQGVECLQR